MAEAKPERPPILLVDDYSSAFPLAARLEPWFTVHRLAESVPRALPPPDVRRRIRALATTTNKGADRELLDALPNLELIAVAGGHFDRIDRETARRRDIAIVGTPGVSAKDVADLVFGLAIAVLRRIPEGDRFVRAGLWPQRAMGLGRRLNGRRLGILGLGRIGREVARRAEPFDMPIAYSGPRPKPDVGYAFETTAVGLARRSDVLVVTCRSGPDTRRIVGPDVIAALGPAGYLVSVARGAVDEPALIAALEAGTIAGAGLDVFDDEPAVPAALLGLDNVVLLAHTGSKTEETKAQMADLVVANLRRHFARDTGDGGDGR